MKRVEVSAICDGFAISPDGEHIFMFLEHCGHWQECDFINTLSMWNIISKNKFVHRGIFTIKLAVY